jgi:hypothetical protein
LKKEKYERRSKQTNRGETLYGAPLLPSKDDGMLALFSVVKKGYKIFAQRRELVLYDWHRRHLISIDFGKRGDHTDTSASFIKTGK